MELWISFSKGRNIKWKGHDSLRGVRQAIAYDRGRGYLRIYAKGEQDGWAAYTLVPRADWERVFGA